MFKRVISSPGFWKSVFVLSIIYAVLFFIIQWAMIGMPMDVRLIQFKNILIFLSAGLVVGFSMSYGKFWGKLKQDDYKNK